MKKINLLKSILDLFWFTSILALIGLVVFAVIFLTSDEMIPIVIKSKVIEKVDVYSKILIIAQLLAVFLFLGSIYYLRKLVVCFQNGQVFSEEVIQYLRKMGNFLISYSVLSNASVFIYTMIVRQNADFEFGIGSYDSFLVCISIGLFFLVLSEVFTISKNLKEENDLTI